MHTSDRHSESDKNHSKEQSRAEQPGVKALTSVSLNCRVPRTACSRPSFLDALSNISASKDLEGLVEEKRRGEGEGRRYTAGNGRIEEMREKERGDEREGGGVEK